MTLTSVSLDGVTVVTVVAVGVARSQMATLTLVVDVVGTEEATGRFFDSSMLLFNAFWKSKFKLELNSVRPLNGLA